MKVLFMAVECDGNPFGGIDFAMIEIDRCKRWIQNAQLLLDCSRQISPAVTDTITQASYKIDPDMPTNPVTFLCKTAVDNYMTYPAQHIERAQQLFDFFILELRKLITEANPYVILEITDEAYIWLSNFEALHPGFFPTCLLDEHFIWFTSLYANVYYSTYTMPVKEALEAKVSPLIGTGAHVVSIFKPYGITV